MYVFFQVQNETTNKIQTRARINRSGTNLKEKGMEEKKKKKEEEEEETNPNQCSHVNIFPNLARNE